MKVKAVRASIIAVRKSNSTQIFLWNFKKICESLKSLMKLPNHMPELTDYGQICFNKANCMNHIWR